MKRIGGLAAAVMAIGLALVSDGQVKQESWRQACVERCYTTNQVDPELQRQEIVSLERETARAIQLNNGSFFRRVYSEDFAGTLSHGQTVNKGQWIAVIESPSQNTKALSHRTSRCAFFRTWPLPHVSGPRG